MSRKWLRGPYELHASLVLGGIIGGASLAHFLPWPFIFVSTMPFYSLVYTHTYSLKKIFLLGWLGGYALIGTTIYWWFNSYPLDWAGVTNPVQGMVITALTWFVISFTVSFFIGIWSLIAHMCVRRAWIDILFLPLSWVLFEWVRMWGFNVVTWGSGSVPVPYFSFGMLGFALAPSSAFLHVAQIGGVYALTMAVAFGGFLLWVLLGDSRTILAKKQVYMLITLSVFVYLILALIPFSRPTSVLNVAIIEMDIPATLTVSPSQNQSNINTIKAKLASIAQEHPAPDIIVIPEDMRFIRTLTEQGEDPQKYLQSLFGTHEVLLIDSGRIDSYLGAYAHVSFFSSLHGEIASREKYVVIPFGEFIPYIMRWGLQAVGMRDALTRDEANRNYLPGAFPEPVSYHGATLIALVCSEMLSPSLYYETGRGSQNPIFLNLTSLSDFHHGSNPFLEIKDMSIIQSAWGNAPYFQSSNGVPMVRIAG